MPSSSQEPPDGKREAKPVVDEDTSTLPAPPSDKLSTPQDAPSPQEEGPRDQWSDEPRKPPANSHDIEPALPRTEQREVWLRIAVGGLVAVVAIAFVAWLFVPSAPNKGEATFRYWTQLRQISLKAEVLGQMESASTAQQAASDLRNAKTTITEIADEIQDIPINDVDPKVVAYASEYVALTKNAGALYGDAADLIDERQSFQEHAGSFDVGLESLVRSFFGDPLGKYNELNTRGQQLDDRSQQLLARGRQLEQTKNALVAKEMQLRSQMAHDYNRDFPALGD